MEPGGWTDVDLIEANEAFALRRSRLAGYIGSSHRSMRHPNLAIAPMPASAAGFCAVSDRSSDARRWRRCAALAGCRSGGERYIATLDFHGLPVGGLVCLLLVESVIFPSSVPPGEIISFRQVCCALSNHSHPVLNYVSNNCCQTKCHFIYCKPVVKRSLVARLLCVSFASN